MIRVRSYNPQNDWDSLQSIIDASANSFGGDKPKKLKELIEKLQKNDALAETAVALVAQRKEDILGFIMLNLINSKDAYYVLAPLVVKGAEQGKGIEDFLVKSAFKRVAKKASAILVLGDDYYRKFGFESCSNYKLEQPFKAKPEKQMVLTLDNFVMPKKLKKLKYPPEYM